MHDEPEVIQRLNEALEGFPKEALASLLRKMYFIGLTDGYATHSGDYSLPSVIEAIQRLKS